MAWTERTTRNGIEYGGSASQYYWDASINPNATFQLCLANCTTYAYGRVLEEGYPAPVTRIRNANNWHTVVNYDAGWTLLDYYSGMLLMPGDILEWSAVHVAVVETQATQPYVTGSWYTDDNGTAYGDRTEAVMGSTLQSVSDWMIANHPKRFFHSQLLRDENREAGGNAEPLYVLRYSGSAPTPVPEVSALPQNPSGTVGELASSVDFTINITVSNIRPSESIYGNVYCDGLIFLNESEWTYGTYTVDGVLYRYGTKTVDLRYYRESNQAYTTTKYLTFNDTFADGSVNLNTPIRITVEAQSMGSSILSALKKKRKKVILLKI